MKTRSRLLSALVGGSLLAGGAESSSAIEPIRHDAEHYVLLHQYGEQWAAEDKELERQLAEIRKKNGGRHPNIVYILIDDMGFGEFGMPELNKIRGGRTDALDKLAREGAAFTHMYAENI